MINKTYNTVDAIDVVNQAKAVRGEYLRELLSDFLNVALKNAFANVKHARPNKSATC